MEPAGPSKHPASPERAAGSAQKLFPSSAPGFREEKSSSVNPLEAQRCRRGAKQARRLEVHEIFRRRVLEVVAERQKDMNRRAGLAAMYVTDAFEGRLEHGLGTISTKKPHAVWAFVLQTGSNWLMLLVVCNVLHTAMTLLEPLQAPMPLFGGKVATQLDLDHTASLPWYAWALRALELLFCGVYAADASLKVQYMGLRDYCSKPWQQLYLVMVGLLTLDALSLQPFRAFRAFRPAISCLRVRSVRRFFTVVRDMGPGFARVCVPLAFLILLSSSFAAMAFRSLVPELSGPGAAAYALWVLVASTDNYEELLPRQVWSHPIYLTFFFAVLLLGNVFLLSLLLGVTFDVFIEHTAAQVKSERLKELRGLTVAFTTLDPSGTGKVPLMLFDKCLASFNPNLRPAERLVYNNLLTDFSGELDIIAWLDLRQVLDYKVVREPPRAASAPSRVSSFVGKAALGAATSKPALFLQKIIAGAVLLDAALLPYVLPQQPQQQQLGEMFGANGSGSSGGGDGVSTLVGAENATAGLGALSDLGTSASGGGGGTNGGGGAEHFLWAFPFSPFFENGFPVSLDTIAALVTLLLLADLAARALNGNGSGAATTHSHSSHSSSSSCAVKHVQHPIDAIKGWMRGLRPHEAVAFAALAMHAPVAVLVAILPPKWAPERVAYALRLLRCWRLVTLSEGLHENVTTFFSISSVFAQSLSFAVIIAYFFGVAFSDTLGVAMGVPGFESPGPAMMTMIKLFFGVGLGSVVGDAMGAAGQPVVAFFVAYHVVGVLIVFNLINAIVMHFYSEASNEQSRASVEEHRKADQELQETLLEYMQEQRVLKLWGDEGRRTAKELRQMSIIREARDITGRELRRVLGVGRSGPQVTEAELKKCQKYAKVDLIAALRRKELRRRAMSEAKRARSESPPRQSASSKNPGTSTSTSTLKKSERADSALPAAGGGGGGGGGGLAGSGGGAVEVGDYVSERPGLSSCESSFRNLNSSPVSPGGFSDKELLADDPPPVRRVSRRASLLNLGYDVNALQGEVEHYDSAALQHFSDGEAIVRSGQMYSRCFMVREGVVQMLNSYGEGDTVEAGGLFGELAVLANLPQPSNAFAVGPVTVSLVEREALVAMIASQSPTLRRGSVNGGRRHHVPARGDRRRSSANNGGGGGGFESAVAGSGGSGDGEGVVAGSSGGGEGGEGGEGDDVRGVKAGGLMSMGGASFGRDEEDMAQLELPAGTTVAVDPVTGVLRVLVGRGALDRALSNSSLGAKVEPTAIALSELQITAAAAAAGAARDTGTAAESTGNTAAATDEKKSRASHEGAPAAAAAAAAAMSAAGEAKDASRVSSERAGGDANEQNVARAGRGVSPSPASAPPSLNFF